MDCKITQTLKDNNINIKEKTIILNKLLSKKQEITLIKHNKLFTIINIQKGI